MWFLIIVIVTVNPAVTSVGPFYDQRMCEDAVSTLVKAALPGNSTFACVRTQS